MGTITALTEKLIVSVMKMTSWYYLAECHCNRISFERNLHIFRSIRIYPSRIENYSLVHSATKSFFSHIAIHGFFFRVKMLCVLFFCSIYPLLYVIFNLEVDGKKTSHRKRKSGCRKKMHNSRAYSTHWILKFLRLDEGAK